MKDYELICRLFRLYRAYLLANGFVKEVLAEQISDWFTRNQIDYEKIPEEIRTRIVQLLKTYGSIHKAPSPSIRYELEEKLAKELEELNDILDMDKKQG
jgi:hypothetical protein